LRGALYEKDQLFKRDIPGLLLHYAGNVSINRFTLKWSGTRMNYFTHGIELDNYTDVSISNFKGYASPLNKAAFRIFATNGKGLNVDDKKGLMIKTMGVKPL
jgi:hypothetical protein